MPHVDLAFKVMGSRLPVDHGYALYSAISRYASDAAGSRTQVGGTWARTGLPQALASATYNAANHQISFGGSLLTYDLNGNLTSDGTTTYTWDARNRLISLSSPSTSATFQYDPLGRRSRKVLNGTTTDFLYDGLNPVQELSGTTVVANLLTGLGIDEYFTRTDPAGTRALLTDALGSTVALTDPAGAVQTEYTYEPFGSISTAGPTSSNPFQYAGRESGGTGLYHYRARAYSPTLQRFISEDPIGFAGGDTNLYAYVRNRPINATDPMGLWFPAFHERTTRDAAKACGLSDADAGALARANRG